MLSGGCFCGFVRYEIAAAPYSETCCHCSICRRTSGAPFVAWFSVPLGDYRLVSGEPASFQSSDHATRTFCPRCGTPLSFRSRNSPSEIDVTTCSLDMPQALPPRDHTYTSSRLGWVELADDLPSYPEARPEPSG